jgi:uncharacterized protein (TIGR04551 family)
MVRTQTNIFNRRQIVIVALSFMISMYLSDLCAQEFSSLPDNKITGGEDRESYLPLFPLVFFSHHGYFRFRGELFSRLDLGTQGTSSFKPPVSLNSINEQFSGTDRLLTSANMKFRYEPSFIIDKYLKINLQIDAFDNIVLGSTPAINRPDSPLAEYPTSFFSDSQDVPSQGKNAFRDSILVKRVWGEWLLFNHVLLFAGRMPDHFGLGMVHNSGDCLNCNFGDTTDRLGFKLKIKDFYFSVSMDYPAEGVTSETGIYTYGQPYDMEWEDDIDQWTFILSNESFMMEEKEAREKELSEEKPVFDWAMSHTLRDQNLSSEKLPSSIKPSCKISGNSYLGLDYDCYTLVKRGAFLWQPDLWGRIIYKLNSDLKIRLEGEFSLIYGSIDRVQGFISEKTPKDIFKAGSAFESEITYKENRFGLYFGFATGDSDSKCFGVLDCQTVMAADDAKYMANQPDVQAVKKDKFLKNFIFDRDYQVDLIMFREVIGAVTNAYYVMPYYERTFLNQEGHVLSGKISAVSAWAFSPSATPSGERELGVEGDLSLTYTFEKHFRADLLSGIFLPLGAFKNKALNLDPDIAGTLQARMYLLF